MAVSVVRLAGLGALVALSATLSVGLRAEAAEEGAPAACQPAAAKLGKETVLLQVTRADVTRADEPRRRRRRRADEEVRQQEVREAGSTISVSTFFWNVHWECSMAARGAERTCKQVIGKRSVEMVHEAEAEIAVSIELAENASQPASLPAFGLENWTQVDGSCLADADPGRGDAAALAFAPTWRVEKSDGGCLRKDDDTRAFAVALVEPPKPVTGCPRLCVLAIHAPHTPIDNGWDKVQAVCGDAVEQCALAMGDWNTPGHHVHHLWSRIIGGRKPSAPQPDERSCCWPEEQHYGVFDHLATNVRGAVHGGHILHPYQHLEENPVKQHRAVSAKLLLPTH